jgi:hypothetical protein
MRAQPRPEPGSRFDRQPLLFGTRRNQVVQLREVQRYGRDSYGDAEYVSIYGMPPAQWYARGVLLLGRTAVECTGDRLANLSGRAVAWTAARPAGVLVVDPFAGSANTLYWISRHLPAARALQEIPDQTSAVPLPSPFLP